MPRIGYWALGTAALLQLATAGAVQAQTTFEGAGQRTELDCDGGDVVIQGADNTIAIRGACKKLVLAGANNRITIDLARQSTVAIQGVGNSVRWTGPAEAKPRLQIAGVDNHVARAR